MIVILESLHICNGHEIPVSDPRPSSLFAHIIADLCTRCVRTIMRTGNSANRFWSWKVLVVLAAIATPPCSVSMSLQDEEFSQTTGRVSLRIVQDAYAEEGVTIRCETQALHICSIYLHSLHAPSTVMPIGAPLFAALFSNFHPQAHRQPAD